VTKKVSHKDLVNNAISMRYLPEGSPGGRNADEALAAMGLT